MKPQLHYPDAYSLGMTAKTKKCPHCGGNDHGRAGAKGCEEGRAWLTTEAGRKFREKKAAKKAEKKKAVKKAKLPKSQPTLDALF